VSALPLRRPVPSTPRLRLVVRRDATSTRRRRIGVGVLVATVVAVGSLLCMAALHAVLVAGQVRLDRLERELRAEESRHASLRLDVARREAPRSVVAAAETLGLGPPAAPPVYLAPSPATAEELGGSRDRGPAGGR
jgi:hypothetical protein